jgi:hypothetical protein
MKLWHSLSRGSDKLRGLLSPSEGAMIEVENITSAAALVRAIDASMPRGATLWIDFPSDEAVELFLAERTGQSLKPGGKSSYRLTIRGDNLPMLARLVEGASPRALGIHLGVDHDRRRLLAGYDLDSAHVNVGLSPKLAPEAMRVFREMVK